MICRILSCRQAHWDLPGTAVSSSQDMGREGELLTCVHKQAAWQEWQYVLSGPQTFYFVTCWVPLICSLIAEGGYYAKFLYVSHLLFWYIKIFISLASYTLVFPFIDYCWMLICNYCIFFSQLYSQLVGVSIDVDFSEIQGPAPDFFFFFGIPFWCCCWLFKHQIGVKDTFRICSISLLSFLWSYLSSSLIWIITVAS